MSFEILVLIVLLIAAVEDFFRKEISLWLPMVCGLISLICVMVQYLNANLDYAGVLASMIPGAILLLVAFSTGQEIGYGDGLMALAMAPVLGFDRTCFVLIISMTLSSLYSILYLIIKRGGRKSSFPFIPFLAVGMGVALLA
ncbi:MAG: prepilin peptidase [Butyrivibrio sp.]|nr:prepilin peptidase [Butyrivibrio sp.]